jgi:hypothetical protein
MRQRVGVRHLIQIEEGGRASRSVNKALRKKAGFSQAVMKPREPLADGWRLTEIDNVEGVLRSR